MFAGDGLCTISHHLNDDKRRLAQPSVLDSTLVLVLELFFELLFGVQVQISLILCDGSMGVIPWSEDGDSKQKAA